MLCLLLTAACAGAPATPVWEYRVLDVEQYYGEKLVGDAVFEMLKDGQLIDRHLRAQREWAKKGWDIDRTGADSGGDGIILRRNRLDPQPFEVVVLKHADLVDESAAEVQHRLNELTADGWTLVANNSLWFEFHRPL